MALPKLDEVFYKLKLPISKKEIEYRPYTYGEQKNLMLLQQRSNNDQILYNEVLTLMEKCTKDVSLKELYLIDFKILFFNIVSASQSFESALMKECPNCQTKNKIFIDLDNDIALHKDIELEYTLELGKDKNKIICCFKQPTLNDTLNLENDNDENKETNLPAYCLTKVIKGEEKYDFSIDEAKTFVEQFPQNEMNNVIDFIQKGTELISTKKEKCTKCETDISLTSKELESFLSNYQKESR